MLKHFWFLLGGLAVVTAAHPAEPLTPQWEDLTSSDFRKAIAHASETCLLPMGSIDKFGPAGPLGSDLLLVRAISLEAARSEYAVVFPSYYAGGTEAYKGFAGTVTYSTRLQYDLLDETTHEMARNGCRKILIVNGNSGSNALISEYMSHLTATPHDYAVYSIYGSALSPNAVDGTIVAAAQPSKPGVDGHGGEDRISAMLVYYPALVHLDRAHDEPLTAGPVHPAEQQPADASVKALGGPGSLARANAHIQQVQGIATTLPTGYSGDASGATVTRGRALVANGVQVLIEAIREVKADSDTINLQKQLSERMATPGAAR
jgi:creatinine amidohydrolase